MNQASRNVLSQLDKVDNDVIDFFVPAAERLMTSESPARVLAAALASMSGFRKPPRPRSLLTYEEGLMTLRILGGTGMDGFAGLTKVLAAICKKGHIAKVRVRNLCFHSGPLPWAFIRDRSEGWTVVPPYLLVQRCQACPIPTFFFLPLPPPTSFLPSPPFVQNLEFSIGKMKVLENQNGLDGAAFDLPYNDAMVRMGE